MSVMEPHSKRTLTGRRRGRPRSVIASGAPPESEATGFGPVSTLSPAVMHVVRPGPNASMQADIMQLEWEEDDEDRHSMVGFGGALLCRALGAMGSLRRPVPVMASVPSNIPGSDRRRRASVHVLDEFALYDRHRRCSQLPIGSPMRLPTPPPPPSGPPPPPPDDPPRFHLLLPPATASVGTTMSCAADLEDPTGQITIQVTPASPRYTWTSNAETQAGGPAPGGGAPVSAPAPAISATEAAACNGDATAGWSCAWSRRRRRSSTQGGSMADSEPSWGPAAGVEEDRPDDEEVIGYGSECMAGVASAVIAALLTAGVVYWLYVWQEDDAVT